MKLFSAGRIGRACLAFCVAVVLISQMTTAAMTGGALTAQPDNPWHRITDFDMDDDHGYLLRSPFDAMTETELAAVPRGNRIRYNAPSKCAFVKVVREESRRSFPCYLLPCEARLAAKQTYISRVENPCYH